MNIVCVLKSGGWKNRHMNVLYGAEHVQWLAQQVAQHVTIPHRFVCMSDVEVPGVEVLPLLDNWPGWWSKLEMFREFGQAFYLDLDTVVVDNIDKMLQHEHTFTVLRNLSARHGNRIGSGLMAWKGDYSHLYKTFKASAKTFMAQCTTSDNWGDQGFIERAQLKRDYFQDLFPESVVSYKFGIKDGKLNPGNRIVCFHGEPRPWQVKHSWVPPMSNSNGTRTG